MKSILSLKPFNTAEFMRHVWTEFSLMRLIIIPVVIVIMAMAFSGIRDSITAMYVVSLLCALGFHMILGNLSAAAAMRFESTDNTWDFQRMSALTSGELSMGKLYGSTSFAHYCTAIALIINITCAQFMANVPHNLWIYITFIGPLSLILCGLLGQSLSFLISTHTFSMKRKGTSSGAALAGMFVGGMALYYFTSAALKGLVKNGFTNENISDYISWHGIEIDTVQFFILSIAFFLICTHTGIYRTMRTEMQYKNMPFVWIGFITAILVYLTGLPEVLLALSGELQLNGEPFDNQGKMILAAMMLLPIVYIGGYSWSGNIVGYTRFFTAVKNKDASGALTSVPPWFINIAIAILLVMTTIATAKSYQTSDHLTEATILTVGVLLLVMRDVIMFHAILMPGATKHAGFFLVIYLLCVYFLGPKIYSVDDNLAIFFPSTKGTFLDLTPLVVQIFLAIGLLYVSFIKANKLANKPQDEAKA